MKPRLSLLFSFVMLATILSFSSQAQTDVVAATNSGPNNLNPDSKQITGTIVFPEKLLKSFSRNFPKADNQKWTTTTDAYLANFTDAGKLVNASFNKKGQFVYALIYCKDTDLPEFIQGDIRKTYPSAIVYKVIEIKKPGMSNYEVILQNATEYITLKITADGEMQEEKRIMKTEG